MLKELQAVCPGLEYVDLDVEIEEREELSVSTVFANKGEAYFRVLESSLLKEYVDKDRVVVSAGGGIVSYEESRHFVQQFQNIIYLKVSQDTILKRLTLEELNKRPLFLDGGEELEVVIKKLMNQRCSYYEELATHIIQTDNILPCEVAKQLGGLLKQ